MKLKLTVLAIAAAAFAPAAFATKPATHPTHPTTPASTNAAHPSVMYVLHGTITAYTAVNGTTNGSVTLTIKSANHPAAQLNGKAGVTFVLSSSTNVVGTPTVGHNATLKWRGTKTPTGQAPAMPGAALQLIDQGSAS
jgi:hypothetical protein